MISEEERDLIIDLYENGYALEEISEDLNIQETDVYELLINEGLIQDE